MPYTIPNRERPDYAQRDPVGYARDEAETKRLNAEREALYAANTRGRRSRGGFFGDVFGDVGKIAPIAGAIAGLSYGGLPGAAAGYNLGNRYGGGGGPQAPNLGGKIPDITSNLPDMPLDLPKFDIPKFDTPNLNMPEFRSYFGLPKSPLDLPEDTRAISNQPGSLDSVGDWLSGAKSGIGNVLSSVGPGSGALQNLAFLAGLSSLGLGLSTKVPATGLEEAASSFPNDTDAILKSLLAQENALRSAREQQYTTERQGGLATLEQMLGSGNAQALEDILRPRIAQLNRQGLLAGPSGALNESLAQAARQIRNAQLPALLNFQNETISGLGDLRNQGLEGELSVGRTGVQRNFGLSDQVRQARLLDRVAAAEQAAQRRKELLALGQSGIQAGLGSRPMQQRVGNMNQRSLEDQF